MGTIGDIKTQNNMSNTKVNYKDFLIIEVPEDAQQFVITNVHGDIDLVALGISGNRWIRSLNPGNYSILFATKECTEEQAKKIVDKVVYDLQPSPYNDWAGGFDFGFRDYSSEDETEISEFPFVRKALQSLTTLLTHLGLDASKNYLILKNTK